MDPPGLGTYGLPPRPIFQGGEGSSGYPFPGLCYKRRARRAWVERGKRRGVRKNRGGSVLIARRGRVAKPRYRRQPELAPCLPLSRAPDRRWPRRPGSERADCLVAHYAGVFLAPPIVWKMRGVSKGGSNWSKPTLAIAHSSFPNLWRWVSFTSPPK
jgi:hypothetical protein